MINRNPDPSSSSAIDAYLQAERVRAGWEEETQFRSAFERFVFDQRMTPTDAEIRALKF